MSSWDLIGIIILVVVLIIGIAIKLYTRQKLNDLDGVDSMFIVEKEDREATNNSKERHH